ncbi:MAG: hypothetical protein LBF84_02655 [Holosporales bacterium]|jgi:hypothetical protein|nr:hypothetical protein [Holosporales bacterium]
MVISFSIGCGLVSAEEQPLPEQDLGTEAQAKKKLVDQFREAMYEVLRATRLISDEEVAPPQEGSEEPATVFASIQQSIGMTENDIVMGGNIKQRLESLTRTVESNNHKLAILIAQQLNFQQETRRNMNFVMEDIAILKEELHKIRGLLFAHDINTQKIINDETVLEIDIISALQSTLEEILESVEKPPAGPFSPYDITSSPGSGWPHWPHGHCQQGDSDEGADVGEGASGDTGGAPTEPEEPES